MEDVSKRKEHLSDSMLSLNTVIGVPASISTSCDGELFKYQIALMLTGWNQLLICEEVKACTLTFAHFPTPWNSMMYELVRIGLIYTL